MLCSAAENKSLPLIFLSAARVARRRVAARVTAAIIIAAEDIAVTAAKYKHYNYQYPNPLVISASAVTSE